MVASDPVSSNSSVVAATEAAVDAGGDAATPIVGTDSPSVGTSPPIDEVAEDAPASVSTN